jgi:hypothetical protein
MAANLVYSPALTVQRLVLGSPAHTSASLALFAQSRCYADGPAAVFAAAAPFEFDFEEAQLTEQNVRDLVYEEMKFYHPEL